jgi:hypothetical protein
MIAVASLGLEIMKDKLAHHITVVRPSFDIPSNDPSAIYRMT